MMKKKTIKMLMKTSLIGAMGSIMVLPTSFLIANNTNVVQNDQNNSINQENVYQINVQELVSKAIEIKNNQVLEDQTDNPGSENQENGSTDSNGSADQEQGKGYIAIPIGQTGISIKIPDFSSNPQKAANILNTYNTESQNIDTSIQNIGNINNIYSILEFDNTLYGPTNSDVSKRPEIFNLGSKEAYLNNYGNSVVSSTVGQNTWKTYNSSDLTNANSLPAFENKDNEQKITQSYLNEQGILALQITAFKQSSGTAQSVGYYILLSGFGTSLSKNSASSNPMLPGNDYVNSVGAVSDQTLLNNIEFDGLGQNNLTKSVVSGTRINEQNTGTISMEIAFKWSIPENIKFSSGFQGLISQSRANSYTNGGNDQNIVYKETNFYKNETDWKKDFTFTGFQPAPNISNVEIIGIVAGVIGSVVVICSIAFLLVKVFKRKNTEKQY